MSCTTEIDFSTVQVQDQVLAGLTCWEPSLGVWSKPAFLTGSSHGQRRCPTVPSSSYKDSNPYLGLCPSWPHLNPSLPKGHTSRCYPTGGLASMLEFGRDTNIHSWVSRLLRVLGWQGWGWGSRWLWNNPSEGVVHHSSGGRRRGQLGQTLKVETGGFPDSLTWTRRKKKSQGWRRIWSKWPEVIINWGEKWGEDQTFGLGRSVEDKQDGSKLQSD